MSPKIQVINSDANVKSAEFSAIVTVGHPDTAARYTKELGYPVNVGDQIDLGTIATYNQNWFLNLWNQLRMRFHKPRLVSGS